MEWTKNLMIGGMPVGGVVRGLNVQQTAALGGVAFGVVGSKFYSQDLAVNYLFLIFLNLFFLSAKK